MHSRLTKTGTFQRKIFSRIISMSILVAISAIPHLAIAQATTLPTGNALYSKAISAMRQLPMPRYIDYAIETVRHHLSLGFECRNDSSNAFMGTTIAIRKIKHQSFIQKVRYDGKTGSGIFVSDGGICSPFPLAPEVRALVPTGADTSVGATPSLTQPVAANSAGPIDLLKVIAKIETFSSRYYDVVVAGIVPMNGSLSYHLQLTARDGDESSHPLTDMYVDTKTHLVRAVVLGGGKRGFIAGGGGYGQFNFGWVGKYWLVTSINVSVAGHMLFLHQNGSETFTFSNFTFPDGPSK